MPFEGDAAPLTLADLLDAEGRIKRGRLRVPGPIGLDGTEVVFPEGHEGGRQYIEPIPGVRLPSGQDLAERPWHHAVGMARQLPMSVGYSGNDAAVVGPVTRAAERLASTPAGQRLLAGLGASTVEALGAGGARADDAPELSKMLRLGDAPGVEDATTADVVRRMADERPRSPVPEYLLKQQREGIPGARAPDLLTPMVDTGKFAAELTGIPSIYRGATKLADDDSRGLHKAAGLGEMLLGMAPGVSMTRMGAHVVGEATKTLPRFMATMGAPDALRVADEQRLDKAVAGEARAQEAPKPPEKYDGKPRTREFTLDLQKRVGVKQDGIDSDATRAAEHREAMKDYKAEVESRQQAQERQQAFELQKRGLDLKQKEQDAKDRASEETAAAREAADLRKIEADKARTKVREDESPYARYARTVGPWLGILPGIFLGNKLAKWSGDKLTSGAQSEMERANALLRGNPKFAEKLGNVNQFVSEGQPAGTAQNLFLRDDKAKRAPFWKANPDAPQSSALYPAPPKTKEYILGAALPSAIGGGEMAAGGLGSYYYGNQAEDAARAMNDPNASSADVHANAARRDSAETKAAIAESLMRVGMGTAGYGVAKSAFDTFMRPSMRPNVGKADAWRNDIAEQIAKTRAKEAGKAAAKKTEQQAGTAATQGQTKPNGAGGAAPLIPLAAGSLLPGEPPTREPSLLDSNAQLPPDLPEGHTLTPSGQLRLPDGKFGPKFEGQSTGSIEADKSEQNDNYRPRRRGSDAGGLSDFLRSLA